MNGQRHVLKITEQQVCEATRPDFFPAIGAVQSGSQDAVKQNNGILEIVLRAFLVERLQVRRVTIQAVEIR